MLFIYLFYTQEETLSRNFQTNVSFSESRVSVLQLPFPLLYYRIVETSKLIQYPPGFAINLRLKRCQSASKIRQTAEDSRGE